MSTFHPRSHARSLYPSTPTSTVPDPSVQKERGGTSNVVGMMQSKSSSESLSALEKPLPLGISRKDLQGSRSFRHIFQRHRIDPDSIATQPSVFDDPSTLEVYRPPPEYENVHLRARCLILRFKRKGVELLMW